MSGTVSQVPSRKAWAGLAPAAGISSAASLSSSPAYAVSVTVFSAVVPSFHMPFSTLNVTLTEMAGAFVQRAYRTPVPDMSSAGVTRFPPVGASYQPAKL